MTGRGSFRTPQPRLARPPAPLHPKQSNEETQERSQFLAACGGQRACRGASKRCTPSKCIDMTSYVCAMCPIGSKGDCCLTGQMCHTYVDDQVACKQIMSTVSIRKHSLARPIPSTPMATRYWMSMYLRRDFSKDES